MITKPDFHRLVELLGQQAADDIEWSERLREPADAEDFALEAIFVVCNSGMRNTVARQIYDRCVCALRAGRPVLNVFGHRGKAGAIEILWRDRETLFRGFIGTVGAPARLEYLGALPWIGSITKYHLAKNFGQDLAKPDVHLQRLADREGCTPQQLCERLAAETGLRVATVDTVLWRACANGVLNSRTGAINTAGG